MRKSFTIIALAALVMLAGCKKNEQQPSGTKLSAGIEQHKSDSKTSLNPDDLKISWTTGDQLYVNNGSESAQFTLTSGADTPNGEFATTGDYTFANENNVAVYPYNQVSNLEGTTVTMTLPAEQNATVGTFGNGANPMLGVFNDPENIQLTSLCGALCLQLTGEASITAIEIEAASSDVKLNGTFTVADYTATEPALTYSEGGSNSIRLNCTATLTADAQKFFVVLPAGTLTGGFTMKVYNGTEIISGKSTANNIEIEKNKVTMMNALEVLTVPNNPDATTTGVFDTWATLRGDYEPILGINVDEVGFYWGSSPLSMPSRETASLGSVFSYTLSGLSPNTTYYYKSFIKVGTTEYMSDVHNFTTSTALPTAPTGCLRFPYSVAANKQVYFSSGNLQYIGSASTPYWKFADHQWDFIGASQATGGVAIDRDLFGWGTSGWNNGNIFYQPYDTLQTSQPPYYGWNVGGGYGPRNGGNYNLSLTGDYANADWGVYNNIRAGSETVAAGTFRTMTMSEWEYLLARTVGSTSNLALGGGFVNGVRGLILLPDNWDCSVCPEFSYGSNSWSNVFNETTTTRWSDMEAAGCAFLPCAGYRATAYVFANEKGIYWSSTSGATYLAYRLVFEETYFKPMYYEYRWFGLSVRLVEDVE